MSIKDQHISKSRLHSFGPMAPYRIVEKYSGIETTAAWHERYNNTVSTSAILKVPGYMHMPGCDSIDLLANGFNARDHRCWSRTRPNPCALELSGHMQSSCIHLRELEPVLTLYIDTPDTERLQAAENDPIQLRRNSA